ncbi:MAG TPA: hypothetical protein VF734_15155 [Pseudonocardiaceae bacterium]
MNIAELSTAALRCAPAGCRVGTVLAVPGRVEVPGLLAELTDRLALDGYAVVVLSGNPQHGAIGLVGEVPQHAEPVVGSGRRRHRCGGGTDDGPARHDTGDWPWGTGGVCVVLCGLACLPGCVSLAVTPSSSSASAVRHLV